MRSKRLLSLAAVLVACVPIILVHRVAFAFDRIFFPGLRNVKIRRPLFVVGPPRSGTTVTHRLLACNSAQFTTLPLWELILAPALIEKFTLRGLRRLDRLLGSPMLRLAGWLEKKCSHSLQSVHQTSLFLPEEDYLGLLPFGGCFLVVLLFPKARWVWRLGHFSRDLEIATQDRLLLAYKGLLQRHLYFRGEGRTLLSKNPTFCAWLPRLVDEFPDSCFLALTRSPSEIVASQLSSVREGLQWFGNDPQDPEIRDAFLNLLADYNAVMQKTLRNLPNARYNLVNYLRLKTSSAEVVIECLERFEYCFTSEYRSRLIDQSQSVSEYRSGHRYALEEFGLTASDVDNVFAEASGESFALKMKDTVIHS